MALVLLLRPYRALLMALVLLLGPVTGPGSLLGPVRACIGPVGLLYEGALRLPYRQAGHAPACTTRP